MITMQDAPTNKYLNFFLKEKALTVLVFTALVILLLHNLILLQPYHYYNLLGIFIWVLCVILYGEFAVVRHARAIATLFKEPVGTLVLTLSIITIEMMAISSVM